MRTPEGYEEMIRKIAIAAREHGFVYQEDTLADRPPGDPGHGHTFEARVLLKRWGKDFMEDAPIPFSDETLTHRIGK